MSRKALLVRRLGMAKMIGFAVGLLGFAWFLKFWPGVDMWTRVGFLLWYTTFGVWIGILGVVTVHPVLKFSIPFWFRGIAFGGWLNLVLVFLMHDRFSQLMQSNSSLTWGLQSPFWFVVEGMILGVAIDGVSTWFGGEGSDLLN